MVHLKGLWPKLGQDKKIKLGKIQGMARLKEYSQGEKEVCVLQKKNL